MSKNTQDKILALETLLQESEKILPIGAMVPSGEVAAMISNWGQMTANTKQALGFRELVVYGEALQRFRRLGFPVAKIMEIMAVESQGHPQFVGGVKSGPFLDMARVIVKDEGDIVERIGRFISLKFGAYLCYDPRYGGVSILSPASEINMSAGNYEHILMTAIRREFSKQLSPAQSHSQWLTSVIQDSVRKHLASETPIEELDRVYEGYSHMLPPLDPEQRPTLLSEGQGNWAVIYQRLAALFKVYDILGKPREEELMTRGLLGAITRTYSPGSVMQWTLLLQGKGACGKSVLGQIMALDTAPAVLITPSDLGKAKTLESMAGASVVVLDEMDVSVSKRDIADNKSFLSQTASRIRRAYRRDAETIHHTWTVISTTNAETLPHDDGAEMRRYGLIRLSGGAEEGDKRAKFLIENRRYLQAILVHLYKAGYPIDLCPQLLAMNKETSRDLIEVPGEVSVLEGVVDSLAKLMVTSEGHLLRLTTKTIWQLTSSDRFHPRRAAGLTHTLENKGWKYTRTRNPGSDHSKFWLPPNLPDTIRVKALHPDNLHILRKAVAAQTVATVEVGEAEVSEHSTHDVEIVSPPTAPTFNTTSKTYVGPLDENRVASQNKVKVKALKLMITQAGKEPPNTEDLGELVQFYQCCFS